MWTPVNTRKSSASIRSKWARSCYLFSFSQRFFRSCSWSSVSNSPPGQPTHTKDILFFRPEIAATRPPELQEDRRQFLTRQDNEQALFFPNLILKFHWLSADLDIDSGNRFETGELRLRVSWLFVNGAWEEWKDSTNRLSAFGSTPSSNSFFYSLSLSLSLSLSHYPFRDPSLSFPVVVCCALLYVVVCCVLFDLKVEKNEKNLNEAKREKKRRHVKRVKKYFPEDTLHTLWSLSTITTPNWRGTVFNLPPHLPPPKLTGNHSRIYVR